MDWEKFFLAIVKFHKMSQMSQQKSNLRHFQWRKWMMDYGIFRLRPTLIMGLVNSLTLYVDLFILTSISVTGPVHVIDLTHGYVWYDSMIWVTWLIRMRDMAHRFLNHSCTFKYLWVSNIWVWQTIVLAWQMRQTKKSPTSHSPTNSLIWISQTLFLKYQKLYHNYHDVSFGRDRCE